MALTRIWNITDGGQEGVTAHNRMVLGKVLKPGQSLRVDEDRLAGATKVRTDIGAKLLHVGARPPAWYAAKKKPPRAVADARRVDQDGKMVGKKVAVAKGHERLPAEAMASDVSEKIDEAAPTEAVVDTPTEEAQEEASEESAEESSEDDSFGSRRRRRRR